MDAKQADRRIILSRRRLAAAVRGDAQAVPAEEIAALQEIAEAHPGKAMKIGPLIGEWILIADRLKALH